MCGSILFNLNTNGFKVCLYVYKHLKINDDLRHMVKLLASWSAITISTQTRSSSQIKIRDDDLVYY